ncbi:SRPBCC family protein [Solirubrobacter ginsenosidimutans]|uniref:SRPBCC family protein n=2 Tax=Solirubrobacter ginsenosidimutans TaxID=490573 RepID=A0A9X3MZQ8_9ACTN|nr:SRPBCC family protein [Solirubrobacter ginsenosidimutans]
MVAFQTSVRIMRPRHELFAYVADPTQFPHWNSAVESVRATSTRPGEAGSTFLMRRALPTGPAENTLEILELTPPTTFAIRTTSGPTPFVYRYRFMADGVATILELDATVELAGLATLAGPLAGRAVRRGVDANLATLKHLLEAGAD